MTLFADDVIVNSDNGWDYETEALGAPSGGCPPAGQNGGVYIYALRRLDAPVQQPLRMTSFQNFTLPPGQMITDVRVDVRCRYRTGTTGRVRIFFRIPELSLEVPLTSDFFASTDACAWRLGEIGNVTGLVSNWTQARVNQIQLQVRDRSGTTGGTIYYPQNPDRPLRVKAVRIQVTYAPIPDCDGDGIGDAVDNDDDNDGIVDSADPADCNPDICGDSDGDGCDDCSIGTDGFGPLSDSLPNQDGPDTDGDGVCNGSDPDDDNDGVLDGADPNDFDPSICGDSDGDGCDDCAWGTDGFGPLSDFLPNQDGSDFDSDGLCNLGDPDDDNDGVPDSSDPDDRDPTRCGDMDGDGCDDCTVGVDGLGPLPDFDTQNDGIDENMDGICDVTEVAFATPDFFTSTQSVLSISVGDVNEDGLPELLTLSTSNFKIHGDITSNYALVATKTHGVNTPRDLSVSTLDCRGADVAIAGDSSFDETEVFLARSDSPNPYQFNKVECTVCDSGSEQPILPESRSVLIHDFSGDGVQPSVVTLNKAPGSSESGAVSSRVFITEDPSNDFCTAFNVDCTAIGSGTGGTGDGCGDGFPGGEFPDSFSNGPVKMCLGQFGSPTAVPSDSTLDLAFVNASGCVVVGTYQLDSPGSGVVFNFGTAMDVGYGCGGFSADFAEDVDIGGGDLDGDGLDDIMVKMPMGDPNQEFGWEDPAFFAFRRTGNASFDPSQWIRLSDLPRELTLADVDMDGTAEVIALYSNQVRIYSDAPQTPGIQLLQPAVIASISGASLRALEVADYSGDGLPDVLFTDGFTNRVYFIENLATPPGFPPENLSCTLDATGLLSVSWTNPTVYDQLEILVDGQIVSAGIAGSSEFETISGLGSGTHEVCLRALLTPTIALMDVCCVVEVPEGTAFVRGDCTTDGSIDIADGIQALSYLFSTPPVPNGPPCADACDANDDELFDISDPIAILNSLFGTVTTPPPPPYPGCGLDPMGDELNCGLFMPCR